MPRPDPTSPLKGLRASISRYHFLKPPKKRPRRKGGEADREPVEPDRPRPLSGGAAAALEFDD